MREPIVLVEPIQEPITLQELRDQCRIDVQDAGQDSLLSLYITAARDYVEWLTERTFHQKTLLWVLDDWPLYTELVMLPGATPLIGIDSITYKDSAGVDTVWGSGNYVLDTYSVPGGFRPAYNVTLPDFTPYPVGAIRIQGTAGIATASPPAEAHARIKQPILLLAASMFENREAESLPNRSAVAFAAQKIGGFDALIDRLRGRWSFGYEPNE